MGEALYRKYRPRKLADVVGQEAVTQTLEKAIKSGKIGHAYLFSGPRGVGKTSVARILAHEVNQLKYDGETIHLDIIEIDGASNRRIDEIRELRDKVHIAPTSAKYKVYIIDEVHMLTKEAFNALLKTLEEPPAHAIFILATTEAHKLPDTIISRTQRFTFKPIAGQNAQSQIAKIAKKEKLDIEPEALELLAEMGEGSFRDSLSLLDQLAAIPGKLTYKKVADLIGYPMQKQITDLDAALAQGDIAGVVKNVQELRQAAVNPVLAAAELSKYLRRRLIDNTGDTTNLSGLLKNLLEVSAAKYPYEVFELSLIEAAANSGRSVMAAAPPTRSPAAKVETEDEPQSLTAKSPKKSSGKAARFEIKNWPKIMAAAKDAGGGLYSALRLAQPSVEKSALILTFAFPLHKKKISSAQSLGQLANIMEQVTGSSVEIICRVDNKMATKPAENQPPKTQPQEDLSVLSNIFGSVEVLES